MRTYVQILRYQGDPNAHSGGYKFDGTGLDRWPDAAEALRKGVEQIAMQGGIVLQVITIPNQEWENFPHFAFLCQ
jgi:hypothetical protein